MRPSALFALTIAAVVIPYSTALAAPSCDGSGYQKTLNACGPKGERLTDQRCVDRLAATVSACDERLARNEHDLKGEDDAEHKRKIADIKRYLDTLRPMVAQQQQQGAQASKLGGADDDDHLAGGATIDGHGIKTDAAGGGNVAHGDGLYHPEDVSDDVQTSLANGDLKGAGAGVKKMLDHGDQTNARSALDQMIQQEPGDPQARSLSAQQRMATGDVQGAAADARIALQGDPNNEAARRITAWADSQGRDINLKKGLALDFGARAKSDLGAGGGAGDARQLATAMPGGWDGAGAGSAKAAPGVVFTAIGGPAAEAMVQARRYAALGDYARAQSEIDRALSYNSKNAEALAVRARVMNRKNDFEGAVRDADAALSLDPRNVAALLERGFARYSLGHYHDALSDVEQALSIDPLNAMGHLYRAMILERMERAQEAVKEYLKAAELDASLDPIVEEALKRLGVSSSSAAVRAARRYWPLWAGAILAALVFLGIGFKRVIKPEWATPVTPLQ